MRVLQFIGVCVAALAVCGCDQGQPMPPDQPASFKPGVDVAAAKKAAESGNALAQTNLGLMYYKGKGVPPDYAEAYLWSLVAAASGYAVAAELLDPFASKLTPDQVAAAKKRAADLLKKIESGK